MTTTIDCFASCRDIANFANALQLHGAPSVVFDLAKISQMLQLNEGKVMTFPSQ